MAPFENPLRHLWARRQPSTPSVPDPIANLDGMSEHNGGQQSRATHPQQQVHSIASSGSGPDRSHHCQAAIGEDAPHVVSSQQCGHPVTQLAVNQNVSSQSQDHDSQAMHDLGSDGQYQDTAWLPLLRTTTTQPPDTPRADDNSSQFSDRFATAIPKAQVKREPNNEEHDENDVFAAFTNEDYHNDDERVGEESQQEIHDIDRSASQPPTGPPSIKPEPASVTQLPNDVTTPNSTAGRTSIADNSRSAAPVAVQDTQNTSLMVHPRTASRNNCVTASITASKAAIAPSAAEKSYQHLISGTGLSQATVVPNSAVQDSFEQYAEDPQQPVVNSQTMTASRTSFRSPSADSVIAPNTHDAEETFPSRGGVDLEANLRMMAQQFAHRHTLLDMGALTVGAIQANPSLLHGPLPTQQQEVQSAPMPPAGMIVGQRGNYLLSNGSSLHYAQHAEASQVSSNMSHRAHNQYPDVPLANQNRQSYDEWMLSGSSTSASIPLASVDVYAPIQRYPTHVLNNQQLLTGMKEGEGSEASDDDEPLATRVPRHRSTTASPSLPAAVNQSVQPSAKGGTIKRASGVETSEAKQDSVVELSDDGEESVAEPFSWKLPDFEAIYFAPSKEDGMPKSKVSIPGLVREEVALTEDHAQQEMQLFLDVFLPNQQALQAPDPEPAHAVLNFHTISVMVLEAFVQYEIGDEMGRGYGFHGGNIAGQLRRPTPPAADEEPVRTRLAKDADVDEIFFAVIDRWRTGIISGKGPCKLIRGCQEFCDVALDVIHYVKEHGLLQPEPKKRRVRSDKGVTRGPRGEGKVAEPKAKATAKRKADAVDGKVPVKKGAKAGKVTELEARKKAKVEPKKAKPKARKSGGVTIVNTRK